MSMFNRGSRNWEQKQIGIITNDFKRIYASNPELRVRLEKTVKDVCTALEETMFSSYHKGGLAKSVCETVFSEKK